MNDRVTLAPVLRYLAKSTGQDFSGRDFPSRLRIQKTVFLLRAMKTPNVPPYPFSSYFYGPYSPSLAREYYSDRFQQEIRTAAATAPRVELAGLENAIRRGNDFLEAAATMLAYVEQNQGAGKASALTHLRSTKPRLAATAEEAWKWLVQNGLAHVRT